MRFLRRYRYALFFLAILVFCAVMIVRQFELNLSRHQELREAFILLAVKQHPEEARILYHRLLRNLERLPTRCLIDDYQRTIQLIDPGAQASQDLVWKYHWQVSQELEKRAQGPLADALHLADQHPPDD
jgi:hypothetical protein